MTSRTAGFWRRALVAALAIFSSTVHALTPSQVFDAVKDSVVVIKSLDGKGEEAARGSGVLLPSGKIATNCHVIKCLFLSGNTHAALQAIKTLRTLDPADAEELFNMIVPR